MLSKSKRDGLWAAASQYRKSLPGSPAAGYLAGRGLVDDEVKNFGLGFVEHPVAGHEMFRGMLAIPYLRQSPSGVWSVVTIRFRRLDNDSKKPKYMSTAGDEPWLFNTVALTKYSPIVAITEGEIDAMTSQICGIPTVGVPGSQMWQPYFRELFLGYREVFIFADGDEAGMQFATTVAKTLHNAKVIPFRAGQDVNSLVISEGKDALLQRIR
jgi:DNA primase